MVSNGARTDGRRPARSIQVSSPRGGCNHIGCQRWHPTVALPRGRRDRQQPRRLPARAHRRLPSAGPSL